MGQALYRKYRSKRLGDVLGQEHITSTLSQALKDGHISHAYLFTGPRGIGKTSIARILAHEVNNLPYEGEDAHIDIIEIDAASNRGIDEIRDLREKVYMAPVAAAYKVYIIDEVHMLTTQAFNALLKTLEEPPAHVIFILATTDVHKLPETIISRTQRYIFRPASVPTVVRHLRSLADKEGITIDDEALQLFAEHGRGSFRDSISLLDQAAGSGQPVDRATAEAMLGLPPGQAIGDLLHAVQVGETSTIMTQLQAFGQQGYRPESVAAELAEAVRRNLLQARPVWPVDASLHLLRSLLDVPGGREPERLLELSLLEAASFRPADIDIAAPTEPVPPPPPVAPILTPAPAPNQSVPKPEPAPAAKVPAAKHAAPAGTPSSSAGVATPPAPADQSPATLDSTIWPQILDALKRRYNTLYGILRMAQPEFGDGTLTLRFQFAFHQKRMKEAKHRKIVGDIIEELTGQTVNIECLYDKQAEPEPLAPATAGPTAHPQPPAALANINNIFGGGELLES